MMRNLLTSIILLSLCFSACQKEKNLAELPPKIAACNNCINFQSLEVGQQSRYLAFEGEKPWEEQPPFRYLKDTLIVQIVGKTGELFQVEEYRTSAPSDLLYYAFRIENDTLQVDLTPRNNYTESWLFSSIWDTIKLPLQQVNSPIIQLKGWNIPVFSESSPAMGLLERHEQLGNIYNTLNVYFDYGPIAYDGTGYYFMYNQEFGIVRNVSLNPWQAKSLGWDLIGE
jgi:hypothetical protein